jgi:chorismate mutase
VPTNGCAVVTISAETMDLTVPLEELLHLLRDTTGVIKAEILAG